MATELGGTQISSLMETLPGIAQVLRSPVADAFVGVIKAAVRLSEFDPAHAEEILRYAVRRNLMTQDETDKLMTEVRDAIERRAERERGRKANAAAAKAAKVKLKPKAQAKPKVKAKKPNGGPPPQPRKAPASAPAAKRKPPR